MPIPFPPGGPQVQSALQNPAQFPDQKLQQYAQGQQPTGQVPPPLAANELTIRNAQRQAAARQTAMQNNPANSPTIFQQKDMELQQKAQQLAAMGQQIQQKEQQLGVLGALMAKKAQDMQARESMGVATLPMRPDMFTAMDGGIVFSGGGGVKRFDGRQGSGVGFLADPRSQIYTNAGEDLVEEAKTKLARLENLLSTTSSEQARTALLTEIARLRNTVSKYSRVPSTVGEPEPTIYPPEPALKKEDKLPDVKKDSSSTKINATAGASSAGVASLGTRPSIESSMERLDPFLSRSPQEENYSRLYLEEMQKIADAYRRGILTKEQAKEMMDARKAEMAEQYGRYSKDRGARQEELIGAMKGEAPTFQERLGAGLRKLPTDLKGVRLGGLFGALGAGAAESDAEYRKREREANIKRAEIRELNAKADLLEERGQMVEADRVRKEAEARKKDEAGLEAGALEAKARGLASLQQLAGKDRDRVATAATSLLSSELNEDAQKRLAEYRAKLEAQYREPRGPTSLEQRVALYKSDPKLYKVLFGDKESSKPPSPRDIIAAKQYAANLPLEQLDLSNDVKMAIKNKAKSLNDPTSDIYQEIQKARDRAAQNILFLDIPEADDLLKRQPR